MNRSSSVSSIDESTFEWNPRESIDQARRDGRTDGLKKLRMSRDYMNYIQTDKHSIGETYAKAYKEGREEAYRKTGSNRRRKINKARKTRRVKKLNGRKH